MVGGLGFKQCCSIPPLQGYHYERRPQSCAMHNPNGHLAKSSQRPGCECVLGGVLRARQVCDDLITTLSAPPSGR